MMDIEVQTLETEEYARIGEELGVFSRRYYDWLSERLKSQSVNPGRRKILRLLRENGPMKMSHLAAELQLDPKRLTKMVDMLEDAGFVRRVEEPADRRARNVELTESGQEAWQPINDTFSAAVAELLEDLSPEDRRRLSDLISHLTPRLSPLPQD